MLLRDRHIKKIAELVLKNLKDKKLITLRVKEGAILEGIEKVIHDDLMAEVKLDQEARKLLDNYRGQIQSGQLDEQKAFVMIKKQLAKDKKMVL